MAIFSLCYQRIWFQLAYGILPVENARVRVCVCGFFLLQMFKTYLPSKECTKEFHCHCRFVLRIFECWSDAILSLSHQVQCAVCCEGRLKLKDENDTRQKTPILNQEDFALDKNRTTHRRAETKSTWQRCASAFHVKKNALRFCFAHFIKTKKNCVQEGKISWNWWKTKPRVEEKKKTETIFLWLVAMFAFCVALMSANFVKNMANTKSHISCNNNKNAPHRNMTKSCFECDTQWC